MALCRSFAPDSTNGGAAGTATVSTFFGDNPTYNADKAFDDTTATWWAAKSGTNEWIKFEFTGGAIRCAKATVLSVVGGGVNTWKNFTIEGSNNDTDWDQLYSGQHPETGGKQTYEFDNETSYAFYRFSITDVWGANFVGAFELELFECLTSDKVGGLKDSSLAPIEGPAPGFDARKPYAFNKRHISEMFRIPDRYLKQIIDKESQFEKPYLDGSYQKMHLVIPAPDWPGIRVPRIRTRHPRKPEIWINPKTSLPGDPDIPEISTGSSCVGCLITCSGNDCEDGFECRALKFCTTDPSGYGRDTEWRVEVLEGLGVQAEFIPGSWHFPSIEISLNLDPQNQQNPEVAILVTFIDGLGYTCTELIALTCNYCPGEDALAVSGGETVGRNGTVAISISGGVGPFSVSLSMPDGQGYWLDADYTETSKNTDIRGFTIYADATSCGSVIATVTDDCGTNDSHGVRNTDSGAWANPTTVCGNLITSWWCYVTTDDTKHSYNFWCYNDVADPDGSPCSHPCDHQYFGDVCNVANCSGASPCTVLCVGEQQETWDCP